MNSFNFIGRGIDAAVREQIALHEAGGEVVQETYDYDADTDTLTPHRSKEEAEDYRYFPEPDLVPLEPAVRWSSGCAASCPELPGERIRRLEAASASSAPTGSSRRAAPALRGAVTAAGAGPRGGERVQ